MVASGLGGALLRVSRDASVHCKSLCGFFAQGCFLLRAIFARGGFFTRRLFAQGFFPIELALWACFAHHVSLRTDEMKKTSRGPFHIPTPTTAVTTTTTTTATTIAVTMPPLHHARNRTTIAAIAILCLKACSAYLNQPPQTQNSAQTLAPSGGAFMEELLR